MFIFLLKIVKGYLLLIVQFLLALEIFYATGPCNPGYATDHNNIFIIIFITTFSRETDHTRVVVGCRTMWNGLGADSWRREKIVSAGGRLFVYIFIYYIHSYPGIIRILLCTICIYYTRIRFTVYSNYTLYWYATGRSPTLAFKIILYIM
jgi:hypothetical protein